MMSQVKGSLLEWRVGVSDEETGGHFWSLGDLLPSDPGWSCMLCLLFMYIRFKYYLNYLLNVR